MFRAIRRGASPPLRAGCACASGATHGLGGRRLLRRCRGRLGDRGSELELGGRRALPHLGRQEPDSLEVCAGLGADALGVGAGRGLELGGAPLRRVHDGANSLAARRRSGPPQLLQGVRHRAQVLGHGLRVEAVGGAREVLALNRLAGQVHSRLSVAVSRRGFGRWALLLDAEGAAHERMDPAEVRVGAGLEVLRRREAVGAGRGDRRIGPERAGLELNRAVRDRIGDARGLVAGGLARGDRVVDPLRVVLVHVRQALPGPDDGREAALTRQAEVAQSVVEAEDVDGAGVERAVLQLARVRKVGLLAAVVAVLAQVPVRGLAREVDAGAVRVPPLPLASSAMKATMIPIDSHQAPRLVP